MLRCPISEYAKPIYESWDRDKIPPPEGYTSWMECWQAKYEQEEKVTEKEIRND